MYNTANAKVQTTTYNTVRTIQKYKGKPIGRDAN
jgi:hypothetical protein